MPTNGRVGSKPLPVQLDILGLALFAFSIATIVTAIRLLRHKACGVRLAGSISAINLLFVVSLVVILLPVATGGDKWQFSLEPSLVLQALLAIPLLTGQLSIVLLVKTGIDWGRERSNAGLILLNTMVLAGIWGFTYFLHTWNLLRWRF